MRSRLLLLAIATAGCGGTPATVQTTGTPPVVSNQVSSPCPVGMVHVPASSFMMGNPEGSGAPNEHPQHRVTQSGYCIDKTEVTVSAYAACVAKAHCMPAPTTNNTPGRDGQYAMFDQFCNGNRDDRQNHPINCIDWNQAKTFCESSGKRLPTEAEWEYAARGSDGRTYPWGEAPPEPRRLNACGDECVAMGWQVDPTFNWKSLYDGSDGWVSTAPVGSYPDGASPFGVLDMAGNVWEWTADLYGRYDADAVTNPADTSHGAARRVFRGGGFYVDGANAVRAAVRFYQSPEFRRDDLGVRCARDEQPPG